MLQRARITAEAITSVNVITYTTPRPKQYTVIAVSACTGNDGIATEMMMELTGIQQSSRKEQEIDSLPVW
jgi:hypothetical protein